MIEEKVLLVQQEEVEKERTLYYIVKLQFSVKTIAPSLNTVKIKAGKNGKFPEMERMMDLCLRNVIVPKKR